MLMPRHLLKAAVAAVVLLQASLAWAGWTRLRSPHFVVVGDAGEAELREVARRVEAFREVLRRALPNATVAMPVPTTIIVFGSDREFRRYGPIVNGRPMEGVGGYCLPGEDANYIAMSIARREEAYPIVFHEYTHALLGATLTTVPVWMNEGLAEVYRTFSQTDGGRAANIGAPPLHHLRELRSRSLMPLVELLAVERDSPTYNEERRRGPFYAQSWLLAHYIFLGNATRRTQLPKYLDLVQDGTGIADAVRQAFDSEPHVLDGELRQHLNGFTLNAVKITFAERVGVEVPLRAEPFGDVDAQAYLAELLAR